MKDVDILGFDTVSDCEAGYDIELMAADGVTSTGITLTVIGSQADAVKRWSRKVAEKLERDRKMSERKGQEAKTDFEGLEAMNIEGAALRVIGWKGVKQSFDRELLKQAIGRNSHWIDQILEASNDLGNFGKTKRQASLSLPDTSSA